VAGTGGDISRAVAAAAAQPDEESVEEEDGGRSGSRGAGRTVGGGPSAQPGSMEEMRQQLHSKWEAEKKLQKR
jgi:hypothetical protein